MANWPLKLLEPLSEIIGQAMIVRYNGRHLSLEWFQVHPYGKSRIV
jgi:hypothetical protein